MKNLLLLLLVASIMGCSSTNIVTMSVIEPAPVGLPPSMKKIGIINRSQTGDEKLDKIDKVFSMEGKNLDHDGALESIIGLEEELKRNSRLDEIRVLSDETLEATNFGTLPNPLAWDNTEEICKKYNLDGLFVLEFYDTESKINYSTKQVKLSGPLGIEVPAIEHHASALTIIKTGWRIYDTHGKNIIDEFTMNKQVSTVGKGINPVEAASAITGRKDAVKQMSYRIGQAYGLSIIPYQIRVSRDYYVKGNDNFKIAKRKAQTGNWNGAAELWLQDTNNPKTKLAGQAAYNMAIINEINGELDEAIVWAKKAYENYDNKLALRYVKILENRKVKNELLSHQQ